MISTPGWQRSPVGKDIGGAIIEQIDGSVCFETEEQRAVAASLAAESHVVNIR